MITWRFISQSAGSYGRLAEEYNGLTVLMLMLSSWCNRYHDKLPAPWPPPFIKYLGIARNVVYPDPPSEREREMARCMRCARQISPSWYEKPSWAWRSDYNSLLKYGLPIGFYHSLYGFLISGMYLGPRKTM